MAKIERPLTGGSYIRNKDGSLTRTGGTEETPPATPAEPAISETPIPADQPETSKKGK
ncbi:MAG: hypothetical protein J0I98_11350 [Mesorhizobium sp.]|nr:hypothetical protein [Mesorhizobium sp.]MBN9243380.1 hypothetical protein [Mesorhizobium sp.]